MAVRTPRATQRHVVAQPGRIDPGLNTRGHRLDPAQLGHAPEVAAVFPPGQHFHPRNQILRRFLVALHAMHFKMIRKAGIGEGLFIRVNIIQPQQADRFAHYWVS